MGATRTDLYTAKDLEIATLAKVLGHPARIAIVRHLLRCTSCITGDLTEAVGLAQPTVSQHLKELRAVGLLRGTVTGSSVNYCIDPIRWAQMTQLMGDLFADGPALQAPCCPAPAALVRWDVLEPIAQALVKKATVSGFADVVFICTHNSRRSQMAQAWAHVLTEQLHLPLRVWSGGTEATSCHPNTVDALVRAGFSVVGHGQSPDAVVLSYGGEPVHLFSKRFDDPSIGAQDFTALMTCSDADENCPFLPHAAARLPLRYDDPKAFDGTDQEPFAYDATSAAIEAELRALLGRVSDLLNA